MVIPNTWTWTWTWSVMIPINLVFQWRLIFDTKLKLRYLLSDLKILTQKNPGWSVRNERHTKTDLGSSVRGFTIWLKKMLKNLSTDWSSKRLTMRDLNKIKKNYHSSDRSIITLHWLWQIILMWSQINVLLSIRLTGGWQIDFKVFKPFLNAKKIFLESFKFRNWSRQFFIRKK